MSFPASFNLSDLNGSNGFVINGIDAGYISGGSVSSAGDFNGDGFDDILIGGAGGDTLSSTVLNIESYVVFGSSQGFNASLNLSELNGTNGVVFNKAFTDTEIVGIAGYGVVSAGDINGDGLGDILFGSELRKDSATNTRSANIYAVFGSEQGFGSSFDLSNLNGPNGFVLNIPEIINPNPFGFNNFSSSTAGDINGDGFDDILVGQSQSEYVLFDINDNVIGEKDGQTYIVFGRKQGFSPSIALSSSNLNDSGDLTLNRISLLDRSTRRVSSAGDFNGDGFDDFLLSGRGTAITSTNRTEAIYLVFGTDQAFDSSFDIANLNGSDGFVLNGTEGNDSDSVSAVSSAGDINGDGFDDILIGQSWAEPNGNSRAGKTYVVFGSDQSLSSSLDLTSLNGSNGFVINGIDESDQSGHWTSSAGDFNGDGFDDILIGATDADPNGNSGAGETYIVFGSGQGFNPSLELANLNGNNGFVLNGIDTSDLSGWSASSAGDINSDGFDDILIGAILADSNGNRDAGATYVVFGRASQTAIEWNTETGIVSSFGISLSAGKASTTPIGRTIQDNNWELQTTGDLNGDGQADVILRHALAGQNLAWYMAPGGQRIQSEALIGREVPNANWSINGTGDLNGDGKTDLILRNQVADQMVAWYMDGEGGIQDEALIGRGFGDNDWKIEAVADFNGDDKADFVLRNGLSGQNLLWEMDGSAILAETLIGRDVPDQNWHIEGASDFDSNGTIDLFLRHRGVGQGLLWSMADKTAIASETLISNVPTGVSQIVF